MRPGTHVWNSESQIHDDVYKIGWPSNSSHQRFTMLEARICIDHTSLNVDTL